MREKRASHLAALFFIFLLTPAVCWLVFFHVSTPHESELAGTLRTCFLDIDGRTRSFSCYIPRHPGPGPALVFVLHGSRGTGRGIRARTAFEFDRLAGRDGFIVVYPDGYRNHWNDCLIKAQKDIQGGERDIHKTIKFIFST